MDYFTYGYSSFILIIILFSAPFTESHYSRDIILSPNQYQTKPGKVIYYKSNENNNDTTTSSSELLDYSEKHQQRDPDLPQISSTQIPWEEVLRETVYLALNENNNVESNNTSKKQSHQLHQLQRAIQNAPYIGYIDLNNPNFGDIVALAKGVLEKKNDNEFAFVQNDKNCNSQCFESKKKNGNVTASWMVERIRHRDPDRGYRYELKFTVIPSGSDIIDRNDILNQILLGDSPTDGSSRRGKSFIVRDNDYPKYFGELTAYDHIQPPQPIMKKMDFLSSFIDRAIFGGPMHTYHTPNPHMLSVARYGVSAGGGGVGPVSYRPNLNLGEVYYRQPHSYRPMPEHYFSPNHIHHTPPHPLMMNRVKFPETPIIKNINNNGVATSHLHHHYYPNKNNKLSMIKPVVSYKEIVHEQVHNNNQQNAPAINNNNNNNNNRLVDQRGASENIASVQDNSDIKPQYSSISQTKLTPATQQHIHFFNAPPMYTSAGPNQVTYHMPPILINQIPIGPNQIIPVAQPIPYNMPLQLITHQTPPGVSSQMPQLPQLQQMPLTTFRYMPTSQPPFTSAAQTASSTAFLPSEQFTPSPSGHYPLQSIRNNILSEHQRYPPTATESYRPFYESEKHDTGNRFSEPDPVYHTRVPSFKHLPATPATTQMEASVSSTYTPSHLITPPYSPYSHRTTFSMTNSEGSTTANVQAKITNVSQKLNNFKDFKHRNNNNVNYLKTENELRPKGTVESVNLYEKLSTTHKPDSINAQLPAPDNDDNYRIPYIGSTRAPTTALYTRATTVPSTTRTTMTKIYPVSTISTFSSPGATTAMYETQSGFRPIKNRYMFRTTTEKPVLKWIPKKHRIKAQLPTTNSPSSVNTEAMEDFPSSTDTSKFERSEKKRGRNRYSKRRNSTNIFTSTTITPEPHHSFSKKNDDLSNMDVEPHTSQSLITSFSIETNSEKQNLISEPPQYEMLQAQLQPVETNQSNIILYKAEDNTNSTNQTGDNDIHSLTLSILNHARAITRSSPSSTPSPSPPSVENLKRLDVIGSEEDINSDNSFNKKKRSNLSTFEMLEPFIKAIESKSRNQTITPEQVMQNEFRMDVITTGAPLEQIDSLFATEAPITELKTLLVLTETTTEKPQLPMNVTTELPTTKSTIPNFPVSPRIPMVVQRNVTNYTPKKNPKKVRALHKKRRTSSVVRSRNITHVETTTSAPALPAKVLTVSLRNNRVLPSTTEAAPMATTIARHVRQERPQRYRKPVSQTVHFRKKYGDDYTPYPNTTASPMSKIERSRYLKFKRTL